MSKKSQVLSHERTGDGWVCQIACGHVAHRDVKRRRGKDGHPREEPPPSWVYCGLCAEQPEERLPPVPITESFHVIASCSGKILNRKSEDGRFVPWLFGTWAGAERYADSGRGETIVAVRIVIGMVDDQNDPHLR